MIVDVLYEGLTLAKGANARADGEGLFVELESPMPVGTHLTVRTPDGDKAARVESVLEGVAPGVLLRFGVAAKPAPAPAAEPEPTPAGAASDEAPEAKNGESGDDDEPADPKKSGRQRKKSRKTVMGH